MPVVKEPSRWELWVDRHLDALLLYARNCTRLEGDAEDLVQQALLEMWSKGELSLPLTYTIIRRRAVDLERRTASRERRETELWQMKPKWLEPEVENHDEAARLAEHLLTLSPLHREVVTLHIWSGLSFREIGDIMGTPLQTAVSRYKAALASLRSVMLQLHPRHEP